MKILRNISILAAAAGLFCGCQELEMVRTYAPEDVVAPALRSIMQGETAVEEITVTSENMGETVTFTWDAADFGVKTQINYAVEAAYGADTIAVLTGLTSTSAQTTYEVLNAPLALAAEDGGLGVPVGTPTEVNFLVSATIGDTFGKYYSEGVPVTITVTQAERTYPMIYVVGQYSGWDGSWNKAQKLYSFSGDETNYVGVIGFGGLASGGFKLTGDTNWDNGNWGIDGNATAPETEAGSIQLIDDGGSGNISVYSKNFYRFSFNRSTLVLTKDFGFDQLGVCGELTGWADDADIVMNFDTEKQVFWADVKFPADGEFKVRADGKWDVSWGVATTGDPATEGVLDGGNNIMAPAGNYRLYVNLNNPDEMTWELNAADYGTGGEEPEPEPGPEYDWAVYGNTADSGSDWVDTPMTTKSSMFGVVNVAIPAGGEFLFRDAAQSTYLGPLSSYTTDGSAYTVMVGEGFEVSTDKVNARIADAGSYDFWYVPAVDMAYVAATGEKVGVVPDTYGLVGSVNDWGNSGVGDLAMSEEGGYYVTKGVKLTTDDQIKIRFNNEWNDAENYGSQVAGIVDINTGVTLVNGSGAQNMSVSLDGTYDIYFDKDNLLVYIMTEGSAPETE